MNELTHKTNYPNQCKLYNNCKTCPAAICTKRTRMMGEHANFEVQQDRVVEAAKAYNIVRQEVS